MPASQLSTVVFGALAISLPIVAASPYGLYEQNMARVKRGHLAPRASPVPVTTYSKSFAPNVIYTVCSTGDVYDLNSNTLDYFGSDDPTLNCIYQNGDGTDTCIYSATTGDLLQDTTDDFCAQNINNPEPQNDLNDDCYSICVSNDASLDEIEAEIDLDNSTGSVYCIIGQVACQYDITDGTADSDNDETCSGTTVQQGTCLAQAQTAPLARRQRK